MNGINSFGLTSSGVLRATNKDNRYKIKKDEMDTIKWIFTYLVCLFFMIIIASSIGSLMENSGAAGMLIVIPLMFAVFIGPIYLTNWILKKSKFAKEKISEKANNYIEKKRREESVRASKKKYKNAKNSFKYLSDDKVKEKYEEMKDEGGSMEKLALEEELVDRDIIDYSPMHEKMQNIKDNFT